MIVRNMERQDIEACVQIVSEHAMFAEYDLTHGRVRDMLLSTLESTSWVTWVVASNNASGVLGFLVYGKNAVFSRSDYVKLLAVSKSVTGQGVGSRLIKRAEREAALRGVDLFLLANSKNRSAICFYEKLAYERVGRLNEYVKAGLDELVFRKAHRFIKDE